MNTKIQAPAAARACVRRASRWRVGDGRPLSPAKSIPTPRTAPRWPDFFCQGRRWCLYFEYSNQEHTSHCNHLSVLPVCGRTCFRFGVGSRRCVHGCRSLVEQVLRRCGRRSSGDRYQREGWRNCAPCGAIRVRPRHRTRPRRPACRDVNSTPAARMPFGALLSMPLAFTTAVLDATQLAALRDNLLAKVASFTSADVAVTWAHSVGRPAMNSRCRSAVSTTAPSIAQATSEHGGSSLISTRSRSLANFGNARAQMKVGSDPIGGLTPPIQLGL